VLVPDQGAIRLMAPQEALLVESRVIEGASVHAGDVLFVLSPDRSAVTGDTQVAVQLALAERRRSLLAVSQRNRLLLESQRAAFAHRHDDLERDLESLDAEDAVLGQRIALASEGLGRLEALHRDSFISEAQVRSKRDDLLALKSQSQALRRQRGAVQRELSALDVQRRELPIQHATREEEIARERSEVDQQSAESEARHRLVVRAPRDGVISALSTLPGQRVSAALALATLVPSGSRLQAQLFAPSSAVGFLRAEQPVLLRYEAFPYQKFGLQKGRIASVARTPMSTADLAAQPWIMAAREPMYRIEVDLARQDIAVGGVVASALAPGMQLEADVPIERRRLVEWLFAPVLGLAQRI
jgi:membrane fusion protein